MGTPTIICFSIYNCFEYSFVFFLKVGFCDYVYGGVWHLQQPAGEGFGAQLKRAEVSVDADTGGCGSAAPPLPLTRFAHTALARSSHKSTKIVYS